VLGFPWLLLGHTLLYNEPLRQGADVLGVYGLSFLMAAVNAALAFAVPAWLPSAWRAVPDMSRSSAGKATAMVAVLLLALFVYGEARIAGIAPRLVAGPPIGVIQGNVAQKLGRTDEQLAEQLRQHLELHRQLAHPAPGGEKPALICWAETMVPGSLNYDDWGKEFTREVGLAGIPTLAGANYWVSRDHGLPESKGYYHNATFILDGNGNELGRYYKRRLVAFGEYIPFVRQLPFLKILRSITRDQYMPGETASPVVCVPPHAQPDEPMYRIALNICVEDIHPVLAREAARDGADTLINVTNDGWFCGTFGPRAHLQAAAWRAIEVRRPLLRVTNTGRTVAVDPLGRITLLVPNETVGTCVTHLMRIQPDSGSGPWTLTLWLGDIGAAVVFFGILLASVAAGKSLR
jgi:apolipoprotein N-acyltransferase